MDVICYDKLGGRLTRRGGGGLLKEKDGRMNIEGMIMKDGTK